VTITRRDLLRAAAGAAAGLAVPQAWADLIAGREGARRLPPGGRSSGGGPDVFDGRVLHEARLTLDPAHWKALRQNYQRDEYYPADLSLDGYVVRKVGIRSRGDGSRNPTKPSLRVDVNRYVKGQDFHALKSLVLKNLDDDSSCLRERLAFDVYEAMGVPTPRYAHTRVTVNGEYRGLYGLIEPIRKAFLRSRFGEARGNLFSFEYEKATDDLYDFSDRGEDPKAYIPSPFKPRTHRRSPDGAALVKLIPTLNHAPDATLAREISAYVDVDQFITYFAVENALADSDGFGSGTGRTNFSLYQPPGKGPFIFIPWDKDMTLQRADWPLFQNAERSVLTRRLLADPAWRKTYEQKVSQTIDSFVNARWLLPRLEAAYGQIREAVHADTFKGRFNEEFELRVAGLRVIVERRRQGILRSA